MLSMTSTLSVVCVIGDPYIECRCVSGDSYSVYKVCKW